MQWFKFALAQISICLFASPHCLAQLNQNIATEYLETAMQGEGLNILRGLLQVFGRKKNCKARLIYRIYVFAPATVYRKRQCCPSQWLL
jgi:hypothetical protein